MKVPEPRRMSSGNYYIYLRLNGVGVPVTARTAKECKREAELIKAEYRANKRQIEPTVAAESEQPKEPTVSEAIDEYLTSRQNTLSPSTVRFYRSVQKHRFAVAMNKPISSVTNWQAVVDAEAKTISVKTLRNAFCAVRTSVKAATGIDIPPARFGVPVPHERAFLTADEIPAFVAAAAPTKYAVPLLLALSSMRVSEIQALDWAEIKKAPDFIQVRGAVVFDEHNKYQKKETGKERIQHAQRADTDPRAEDGHRTRPAAERLRDPVQPKQSPARVPPHLSASRCYRRRPPRSAS